MHERLLASISGWQVIVGGLDLAPQWRPPAESSYKVSKQALTHMQHRIRELGRGVLGAEVATRAKVSIQIKELQDTVQNLETEVSCLGQHLDEQVERFDKQRETLTVTSA